MPSKAKTPRNESIKTKRKKTSKDKTRETTDEDEQKKDRKPKASPVDKGSKKVRGNVNDRDKPVRRRERTIELDHMNRADIEAPIYAPKKKNTKRKKRESSAECGEQDEKEVEEKKASVEPDEKKKVSVESDEKEKKKKGDNWGDVRLKKTSKAKLKEKSKENEETMPSDTNIDLASPKVAAIFSPTPLPGVAVVAGNANYATLVNLDQNVFGADRAKKAVEPAVPVIPIAVVPVAAASAPVAADPVVPAPVASTPAVPAASVEKEQTPPPDASPAPVSSAPASTFADGGMNAMNDGAQKAGGGSGPVSTPVPAYNEPVAPSSVYFK